MSWGYKPKTNNVAAIFYLAAIIKAILLLFIPIFYKTLI